MGEARPLRFYVTRLYRSNQDALLASVTDLDDATFRWRPERTNSIAFNLWHCARWADHLQSIVGEATPALRKAIGAHPEIWQQERLARRWGFPAERLGHAETGMGMDEDLSARLPLPSLEELVAYARRAFADAQATVERIDEDDYLTPMEIDPRRATWLSSSDQAGQVVGWVLTYARHDARHLGMIEALKGLRGLRGTATA